MTLNWFMPVLAASTTNADEVIARIFMLFCGIGIVWLATMAMLIYRMNENRRRKTHGEDPLPSFWVHSYQLIKRVIDPDSAPPPSFKTQRHSKVVQAVPSPFDDMPTPDLAMLTGDFDALGLDESFPASVDEARTIPAEDEFGETVDLDDDVYDEDYEDVTPQPAPPDDELDLDFPEEPLMSVDQDTPSDAIELLRVWRDLSDGSLILEINGQRFSSLTDVRDPDLHRRFVSVVKALVELAKTPQRAPVKPPPTPQPAAPPPPAPPVNDEMPSMAPGDMLRQMTNLAMRRKLDTPGTPPPPAPLSIPEQINAVLQARLQTLPQFQDRGIEVQPSLGGLVIIKADGKFYEGVGEVEDDEIRALLEDVVREWEESQ